MPVGFKNLIYGVSDFYYTNNDEYINFIITVPNPGLYEDRIKLMYTGSWPTRDLKMDEIKK